MRATLDAGRGVAVIAEEVEPGVFAEVKDVRRARHLLTQGEGFRIYTKEPDVRALKDIWDRRLGKPVETVQVTTPEPVRVVHEVTLVARKG